MMNLIINQWTGTVLMRIYLLLISIFSFNTFASDVQIITDKSKGQGFLYKHQDNCFVVTPSHVIDEATKISVLTASRKSYSAKLVKNFDIDLALLELKSAKKLCEKATFNQSNKLTSLLKIYEEGVLKSKLADGSTLQTKVNIVGVDETEMLQIKPQKSTDILKQGYSGSVLFIANQPSGILLEVDEGSGYVYRADALNKKLLTYFYPNGLSVSIEKKVPAIADVMEGRIAKNQVLEFKFIGEANSPIEFSQVPSDERVDFKLEIINAKRKVEYSNNFISPQGKAFAFTPSKSGKYTVRVTGTSGHGSFTFNVRQWALNAELRGEGNVLEMGDELSSRLAYNAVVEFHFQGEANSPIEFSQVPSDERVDFKLEIINAKRKVEYSNNFISPQGKAFAFTPSKSGKYTVRVTGTRGHGSFTFYLNKGE
jgi:hypothetical protein